MDDSNVAIRLKHFLDSLGMSSSQFADRCGIPRPSFSQLLNGRNKKLSDVVVKQIHDAFPALSVLWLMFGEGDMYVNSAPAASQLDESSDFYTDAGVSFENANLSDFTNVNLPSNTHDCQMFDQSNYSSSFAEEIERNRAKSRKVVSITIFYDDDSYESFYPGKK